MKTNTLLVLLLVLELGGCDYYSGRGAFDRQIETCSVAEGNGLLEEAIQACGTALAIAEEQEYAQDLISNLLYRLGRLERQRGRFSEAEALMKRSLILEERFGEQGAIASRLVELSLCAAGQDRWLEGAQLLKRALPLADNLIGQDRKTASHTFGVFSVRLDALGHRAPAKKFKAKAEQLAGS